MRKYYEKAIKVLKNLFFVVVLLIGNYISSYSIFGVNNSDNFEGAVRNTAMVWIYFVYTLIFLSSLSSVFFICDNAARTRYFEEGPMGKGKAARIIYFLRSKDFLLHVAIVDALVLILPSGTFLGFFGLFGGKLFLSLGALGGWLTRLVIAVCYFLVIFGTHISVASFWESRFNKKSGAKYKTTVMNFILKLLSTLAVFSIGAYAFAVVVVMAFSTVAVILLIIFSFFFLSVAAILGYFLIIYGRALSKRKKLVSKLQRICKAQRYDLNFVTSPYKTVFFPSQGVDIIIKTKEKTYGCKLLCSLYKKRNMCFRESGEVFIEKSFLGIFKSVTSEKYFFDFEGEKLVVINPIPRDILFSYNPAEMGYTVNSALQKMTTKERLGERKLDVGEKVMGYGIYNSSGFLNAVERNCL